MFSTIKIASRQSPLARIQVQEVLSLLGSLPVSYQLVTLTTKGDQDKLTSLTSNPADDFFTNTLDDALLNKEADITIHSAKDLPKQLRPGLKIFALTKGLEDTDSWVSQYALEALPKGAKIGTSSILRGEMIKKISPDVVLVDIRGTIEERLGLLEEKKIDGLIVATCALKRLGLEKHIKSILPWEGTPLQGQLAIVGRQEDAELEKLFETIDIRRHYGQVSLVGAGPGDPQLITLKAIQALKAAQVVFYDYLLDPSLLRYTPLAQHVYVGKRKGDHTLSQAELLVQLKKAALHGKNIVRLKGGDPLIFGRGAEEIEYLRSYHIPVSVIPGVSSATGIPSSLGVPLTARGVSRSVAFVSGHGEAEEEANAKEITIPLAETIVFLMGLTKLGQIVQTLLKAGWHKDKPIMIISNGTRSDQKIITGTLDTIEKLVLQQQMSAPALIIAGDTIHFYRPGDKKVYLHCGMHPERYTHLGHILHLPTIIIQDIVLSATQKNKLLSDLDESDLVILTSPAAVDHFVKHILTVSSVAHLKTKIFAVIGKATAEVLDRFGISPQLISCQETAQGLYDLLSKIMSLKDKRILLPRSSLPNPFLKEALEKAGAHVKVWTIYENVKAPKGDLPTIPIDGVIFTSPSTFKNFLQDYGTIPASWAILAKGPVTAQAIKEEGYHPHVVGV